MEGLIVSKKRPFMKLRQRTYHLLNVINATLRTLYQLAGLLTISVVCHALNVPSVIGTAIASKGVRRGRRRNDGMLNDDDMFRWCFRRLVQRKG